MTYSISYNDPLFHHHDASGILSHDFQYGYYAGTNRLRETGPFLEDMVYDGGRVLSNNKVYRRITVQGNSYVPAGKQVVLRATEKITLSPQFRAASGRRFRARLVRDEDMYRYDAIGNLVQDQAEGTKITWTPYGKVRTVSAQSDTVVTTFRYDGAGNRIEKRVVTNDTIVAVTRYLRDASGNVMAIYQDSTLQEQPIYGSARLGQYQGGARPACLTLGTRRYELSNHLGNVLTVITDNIGMSADTTWATVVSASDYYPFGLTMAGRNYQDSLYRYGFNGKEKDDQGEWGNTNYDYGFRIYSPEIGKFLSVDPLTRDYPMLTPYQFASNRPIDGIDLDGLEFYKSTFYDVNLTPQISLVNQNEVIVTPTLELDAIKASRDDDFQRGLTFESSIGLSNLRKGLGAINTTINTSKGELYFTGNGLGKVLKTIGRGTAVLQAVNVIVSDLEKIEKKGAAISYSRIVDKLQRDGKRAAWVIDVIGKAIEAGVLTTNDPEYLEDLINFSLDDKKPLLEENSVIPLIDEDRLIRIREDFSKLEGFVQEDLEEGIVEIKTGKKDQVKDLRKLKSKPE